MSYLYIHLYYSLILYISGDGEIVAGGTGPLTSVLRAGVRLLVEMPYFKLGGSFYQLSILPIAVTSLPRQTMFWVAGFWSAIHLIMLSFTPDPISPWLLYAAVYGKRGFPKRLEQIRELDPISADLLEPWFAFGATDTLGPLLDPVPQLLVNYLGIEEVSHFALSCG